MRFFCCFFNPFCLIPRSTLGRGRWMKEEHENFLAGLKVCGKEWSAISRRFVPSRTMTQVRTHAQKYFIKMARGQVFPEEVRSSCATFVSSGPSLDDFEKSSGWRTNHRRGYAAVIPAHEKSTRHSIPLRMRLSVPSTFFHPPPAEPLVYIRSSRGGTHLEARHSPPLLP